MAADRSELATPADRFGLLLDAAFSCLRKEWVSGPVAWRMQVNRIESQFTALKEFALNNSDYRSHEAQIMAILCYLDWRNRKRSISQQDWQEYKRQPAVPA